MTKALNRPSAVNPDQPVREAIPHLVAGGMRPPAAAAAAGVSPHTWYGWLRRGMRELDRQAQAPEGSAEAEPRPPDDEYAALVMAVLQAEARVEGRTITAWQRAFESDWRAAAAFAKARFPRGWGSVPQPELEAAPVGVVMPSLDDFAALADMLEARALEAGLIDAAG